ncbi:hypothetical protein ERO13_D04G068300v2 [Gossypium hirsutum]|uniref:Uncharacterized protein n=2 Tax=Gossypium TaxID=3633 RepID=A0A5J5RSZ5_GOSBA|nr:hypothetical protein ES319_D04G074800v1 [Gossypium barbadense]KAG4151464.1 hypothetical protein ERO13_D04G068300v2 [Gossypium hirsutum]TYG73167.1 hypothetical protein ES288_D04G079200v1 [Gossypium darwinii]
MKYSFFPFFFPKSIPPTFFSQTLSPLPRFPLFFPPISPNRQPFFYFSQTISPLPRFPLSPPFSDHPTFASSLRFQRYFLLFYSLASVLEGLWSVYREFELVYYGITKEDTVTFMLIGFGSALFFGSFLGLLSDLIGRKKSCLVFYIFLLVVGIWKRITSSPSFWVANGHRQDLLNETFWLMTFFESAALIGSQVMSN